MSSKHRRIVNDKKKKKTSDKCRKITRQNSYFKTPIIWQDLQDDPEFLEIEPEW